MIKYMMLLLLASQISQAKEVNDHSSYLTKTKQVSENVWIGPQPSVADYAELAAEEIGAVINNRTAAEMKQMEFEEVDQAAKYNMNYDLLEIGKGHEYSPAKLTAFNDLMTANADNNILLHCRSGHRSTQLYTAWLIKYQDKTPAEALKVVDSTETELNDSVKALLGK